MNLAHQVKLNAEEYQTFVKDLNQWTAKQQDSKGALKVEEKIIDLNSSESSKTTTISAKRIASNDYKSWDKFDVVIIFEFIQIQALLGKISTLNAQREP
jgi:hypothetical protein